MLTLSDTSYMYRWPEVTICVRQGSVNCRVLPTVGFSDNTTQALVTVCDWLA